MSSVNSSVFHVISLLIFKLLALAFYDDQTIFNIFLNVQALYDVSSFQTWQLICLLLTLNFIQNHVLHLICMTQKVLHTRVIIMTMSP